MAGALHFRDTFWCSSKGSYANGIHVLHQKMAQSQRESDEILSFLRDRIACEQTYGDRLIEIGSRRLKLDGFLRDDGASLRKTFESLRHESIELGKGHRTLATNIQEMVLNPLLKTSNESRTLSELSRDEIEAKMKLFDKHLYDLDKARAAYVAKCNAADQAELEAQRLAQEQHVATQPHMDDARRHEFASQRFTIQELSAFLTRMRREIPSQDVRVPIFGTYTGCCSGNAIVHWITQNTKAKTVEEGEHIGQSLADEGFLRLIGQYGNKFVGSPAHFYQWRDQMFELLEANDEEDLSLVKRTKQEAEKADQSYLEAVKRADSTRMQLEVGLIGHMDLLERLELDRINTIKTAFLNFAAIFSNTISITQSVADHLMLFQEVLRPSQDVLYVIEQYRTGAFVPMPILYENFYHGTGLDQVFGVNLDKHCNFTRKKVPQIVAKCLTRIKKSSAALSNEHKLSVWTQEVPLAEIHVLRNKINSGGKITQKLLRLFDVSTVVGVLRLYFMELPGSLINPDEYETVKVIYSSVSDDVEDGKNDARISSVRNLLALQSSARFYTLFEFVKSVNSLIKETNADEAFASTMAQRWGPVILRPLEETAVTMHDKHPPRLLRDLFKMTHTIFEPIRMSREEGNLSRSVTTRQPANLKGRKGAIRASRDGKGGIGFGGVEVLSQGAAAAGAGMVGMRVNGVVVGGPGVAGTTSAAPAGAPGAAAVAGTSAGAPAADNANGAGVGQGTPAKLQRRLGPSRYALARGISAPEMFSQVPAMKKKADAAKANGEGGGGGESGANGETGGASTTPAASSSGMGLGLLTTKGGLLPPAGGDRSMRSPLRQSIVPEATAEEEEDEEDGKKSPTGSPVATTTTTTTGEEVEERVSPSTAESTISTTVEEEEAAGANAVVETPSVNVVPEQQQQHVAQPSEDTLAPSSEGSQEQAEGAVAEDEEMKALTEGLEPSASKKLERRSRVRQSRNVGSSDALVANLTPEQMLQNLQNE
ncbi:hypothetical protein DFQ26_003017 [Actinomortierella ambigua]|nr:hypothetical protein DFQ26_003017 [Actinomortierella ambigua]